MFAPLPEYADPRHLADAGKRFVGEIELGEFPRLIEELLESRRPVAYELAFGRDERNRATVKGRVKATLILQCQRCLGALEYPVDREISLALVEGLDEARGLPDRYEPLLLEESRIRLADLVEDELLLALPQAPKHGPDACTSGVKQAKTSSGQQKPVRENRFAVLAELKQKPD